MNIDDQLEAMVQVARGVAGAGIHYYSEIGNALRSACVADAGPVYELWDGVARLMRFGPSRDPNATIRYWWLESATADHRALLLEAATRLVKRGPARTRARCVDFLLEVGGEPYRTAVDGLAVMLEAASEFAWDGAFYEGVPMVARVIETALRLKNPSMQQQVWDYLESQVSWAGEEPERQAWLREMTQLAIRFFEAQRRPAGCSQDVLRRAHGLLDQSTAIGLPAHLHRQLMLMLERIDWLLDDKESALSWRLRCADSLVSEGRSRRQADGVFVAAHFLRQAVQLLSDARDRFGHTREADAKLSELNREIVDLLREARLEASTTEVSVEVPPDLYDLYARELAWVASAESSAQAAFRVVELSSERQAADIRSGLEAQLNNFNFWRVFPTQLVEDARFVGDLDEDTSSESESGKGLFLAVSLYANQLIGGARALTPRTALGGTRRRVC